MTITSLQADFQRVAREPVVWRAELQQLAIGYFGALYAVGDAETIATVFESTAMAVALITFAESVDWITPSALSALHHHAHNARYVALRNLQSKVAPVFYGSAAPQSHPQH